MWAYSCVWYCGREGGEGERDEKNRATRVVPLSLLPAPCASVSLSPALSPPQSAAPAAPALKGVAWRPAGGLREAVHACPRSPCGAHLRAPRGGRPPRSRPLSSPLPSAQQHATLPCVSCAGDGARRPPANTTKTPHSTPHPTHRRPRQRVRPHKQQRHRVEQGLGGACIHLTLDGAVEVLVGPSVEGGGRQVRAREAAHVGGQFTHLEAFEAARELGDEAAHGVWGVGGGAVWGAELENKKRSERKHNGEKQKRSCAASPIVQMATPPDETWHVFWAHNAWHSFFQG